jgi:hypothetical protein
MQYSLLSLDRAFVVMKKSFAIVACFLLPFLSLRAQSFDYGNDWYRGIANQNFIKLIVDSDGIYRVSKQDLLAAGFDLSGVNPDNLSLIYRGQEVPMYISKANGELGYLEFFGRRNDGRVDSLMYRDPVTGLHRGNLSPNKHLSLFTDESAYFLTWGNQPSAGRYFSNFDPTYTLYSPEQFFRYEAYQEYKPGEPGTEYVRGGGGQFDSFYTLNSDYVTGEGYMRKGNFSFGSPATITIETPSPANSGNPIDINARVFGRSNSPHFFKLSLNGDDANPVVDTTINISSVYVHTYKRSYNALLSASNDLTFQALRAPTDNNNICWASITYDRQPQMDGDSAFWIKDWEKATKGYLQLGSANGNDTVIVYDLRNRFRNIGLIENGTAKVIIQNFPGKRDLWLGTDQSIRTPRIEESRLDKLFDPSRGTEYVIIANRGLQSSAEAYSQYRDTSSAIDLNSQVVYVDEIYDEYGYGSVTPWAIKRFCKDALDNWTVKPRYFLLWGKGRFLTRGYEGQTTVPTFGYPATDYEFISHFDANSSEIKPEAAIGRVNLFDNDEGMAYLDKVNEYEHTPWQFWMKEGVFLGGGGTEGEQNAIGSSFNYMIDIFDNVPYGGKPHYFQKRTASILLNPTTASYHDEIDGGVSVIHFFGHSTSNIQDISIREAREYTNNSRYPLMVAMGCYGGDFTTAGPSFGERWIVQPKRGAIGYLANSSAGYLNPLRDYAKVLYARLWDQQLGQPIGDVLRQTLAVYTDSLIGIQYRNHGRQLNLQGDPAVILYNPQKPDLAIDGTSIFFTPENFTAQDDSFRINVIVENRGLVTEDSFRMTIRQRLPNGNFFDHPDRIYPMVRYKDTLSVMLDNPVGNQLTGQNIFEVTVDAGNKIDEYLETNNRVNIDKVVPGNIPAILSPPEFAIVGENQVSLQASAFFMTREDNVGYIFEIDTTHLFNSPLKANSGLISGSATFVSWDIPFPLVDSTVYFWRVRLSNVSPVVWGESSFKYINNKTGWAQSKLNQFVKNDNFRVQIDEIQQQWDFTDFAIEYESFTRPNGGFVYSINGSLAEDLALNGISQSGVAFVVIDQYSLQPTLVQHNYGEIGFARSPENLYQLTDALNNMNFGDYVIVGSHFNARVHEWSQEVFDALAEVGASSNLELLGDGDPFILMGRKGYPNSAIEVYSPNTVDKLLINNLLLTNFTQGEVFSPRVGPALSWETVFWDWESLDPLPDEDSRLSIYAVRADGSDSLYRANLDRGNYDLTGLDASRFPYLRLGVQLKDSVRRTAPQLDNWHVLYETAPDAVVDPLSNFAFQSDTLWEGQDIFLQMGARNISDINMDSVDVLISLERADRSRLILDTLRIAPLIANGPSIEFEYGFNTLEKELDGDVLLLVEINPGAEQAEQHYFNNLYIQPFHVIVDRMNPLLDVTFDGKHIIDGDYVSPQPEIIIEINDENPFIAVEDSNAFELYFKRGTTAATSYERIFLSESESRVEHVPAQLPDNKARLYFYPGKNFKLPNGDYSLRVQGRDQKGNASGQGENFYEITFRVENESSITDVLNYPNPFSTSTRFVYTLTGAEIPEVFQLHIYTISGKMVKVIDLVELGEATIGQHITQYAWDGTDEYGQPLANGVYIYKVVMKMTNPTTEMNVRNEDTEQYFRNGWGKMYIMR